MLDSENIQNINEVLLLLPTNSNVLKYRFEEIVATSAGKKTNIKITQKKVKICFSGIENNLLRYQVLCVNLDIEAKHIGSTTILRKQINVFDEVICYVNNQGTIIDVLNLKALQQRWTEVKEELLDKHQGSALLDFIEDTNDLLENKEKVIKYISSKEMYGLYFNGFWGVHDIRKPRIEGITLHIEKRIVEDRFNQHLQKAFNHDAKIALKIDTDQKSLRGHFDYKNNKITEAFLLVEAVNTTSKYSVVCLTS
jgi:hypothetical protein